MKSIFPQLILQAICLIFFLDSYAQLNFEAHPAEEQSYRPNMGQWEGDFSHVLHTSRYSAYLKKNGFTIGMTPIEALKAHHDSAHAYKEELPPLPVFGFSYKLLGANEEALVESEGASQLKRNYFVGDDPQNWKSGLSDYTTVRKEDVYPGINLVYKVHPKGFFEYDFVVSPGADPSQIRWAYSGVKPVVEEGDIKITTPYGIVRETIPVAYQMINGRRVTVDVAFEKTEKGFSFVVAEYDNTAELVIDPVIVAATLTGTAGSNNYGHGATYDNEGNVFSFGIGFGPGLPTSDGAIQENYAGTFGVNAVINKFNPTGTEQIFATYLGKDGTYPHSASTNLFGELYVFGSTGDLDFPVVPGSFQTESGGGIDIFISKISPDGTELLGSTYLGGSSDDGRNFAGNGGYDIYRGEVSIDFEGNVYVASSTSSSDFPEAGNTFDNELNGNSDGVVAKFSEDLSFANWISLIGGSQDDAVLNVRIAENGNVVFSGTTRSDDYPTTSGVWQETAQGDADAILGVFSPSGNQLLHSTYVGTSLDDQGYFMDLDNEDNIWIYGTTLDGDNWPVTEGVFTTDQKSLFITKFDPELSDTVVSTAIGGPAFFGAAGNPVAFLVDRCDRVYISAFNAVDGLPLTDDALFDNGGFYLAAFEDDLQTLSFSTYYSENHVDGGTSRFDKKGIVYQGVCSGGNFTTNPDAYATDQAGGWDVGVFKIDFQLSGVNAAFSAPSELDGCAPHEISFSNFSVGDTFSWDFGDGTTSTEFEPTHSYTEPGTFVVTMIASDSLSCNLADTVSLSIDIFSPEDFQPSFTTEVNCESGVVSLINTTGGNNFLDFYWIINGDTLYTTYNASHQFADLSTAGEVSLYAVDEGCELDEIVTQEISGIGEVSAEIANSTNTFCNLEVAFENGSANASSFLWDFGDGTTSSQSNPTHVFQDFGVYMVTLTALNPNTCNGEDMTTFEIEFIEPPVINPTISLSQIGACSDLTIVGEIGNTANVASFTWVLDGEEIGIDDEFSLSVPAPGLYEIELLAAPVGCPDPLLFSDTIRVIEELPVQLEPQQTICYYENAIELDAGIEDPSVSYLWLPGEETTSSIQVSQPGTYTLQIVAGACTDVRIIEVGEKEQEFNANETEICEGQSSRISVEVNHLDFTWEDGSTGNVLIIETAGEYNYSYTDLQGCYQEGRYEVTSIPSDPLVFIPNAFSPNEDGINDIFKISSGDLDEFKFQVFNRWGEKLFETTDPENGWNGSDLNGSHYVPPGIYAYYIRYSGSCLEEVEEKTGSITIIR